MYICLISAGHAISYFCRRLALSSTTKITLFAKNVQNAARSMRYSSACVATIAPIWHSGRFMLTVLPTHRPIAHDAAAKHLCWMSASRGPVPWHPTQLETEQFTTSSTFCRVAKDVDNATVAASSFGSTIRTFCSHVSIASPRPVNETSTYSSFDEFLVTYPTLESCLRASCILLFRMSVSISALYARMTDRC